jgi:hypothetical protein
MKSIPVSFFVWSAAYFWLFATGYFMYRRHRSALPLDFRGITLAALQGLVGQGIIAICFLPRLLHWAKTISS